MSTITFNAPRFQPATPSVRLTKRGKVTVIVVAFLAIAMLALVLVPAVAATDDTGTPQATRSVTVMAGQTLWQIAAEANPNADIRDTVDDIVRLNSLPSASAATPGMRLAVPVY